MRQRQTVMASSSTAIPDVNRPVEQEPLLGRPGDAAQSEGKNIYYNLFIGEDQGNC